MEDRQQVVVDGGVSDGWPMMIHCCWTLDKEQMVTDGLMIEDVLRR
jgi:hypothetical protein